MRILLVEDDAGIAEGLKANLQQRGHAVDWCSTIASAWTALTTEGFDAVLLDLGLPDGDGTSVLQVTVDTKGVPSIVSVAGSSGNAQLDQSAVTAVKAWVFEPATRGGQPVVQGLQVPVNFRLPAVRPDECFQLDGQK